MSRTISANSAFLTVRAARARTTVRAASLATTGTSRHAIAAHKFYRCVNCAPQDRTVPSVRLMLSFCLTKAVSCAANRSRGVSAVSAMKSARSVTKDTPCKRENVRRSQVRPLSLSLQAWLEEWWLLALWGTSSSGRSKLVVKSKRIRITKMKPFSPKTPTKSRTHSSIEENLIKTINTSHLIIHK